jgi:hypothetical protein
MRTVQRQQTDADNGIESYISDTYVVCVVSLGVLVWFLVGVFLSFSRLNQCKSTPYPPPSIGPSIPIFLAMVTLVGDELLCGGSACAEISQQDVRLIIGFGHQFVR